MPATQTEKLDERKSGLRTVQYHLEGFAMSARGAAKALDQQVKKAVAQAEKEYEQGNYRRGVELLQPFVGPGSKKLTQQLERDVVSWLSRYYRFFLRDYKIALPHAQRRLEFTLQPARVHGSKLLRSGGYTHRRSDTHTHVQHFYRLNLLCRHAVMFNRVGLQGAWCWSRTGVVVVTTDG
jgi:hypothetical protein